MKKFFSLLKSLFTAPFSKKNAGEDWDLYSEALKNKRIRRNIAPSAPESDVYRVEKYIDSMGVTRTRAVAVDHDEEDSAAMVLKTASMKRSDAPIYKPAASGRIAGGKKEAAPGFEPEDNPQNPRPKNMKNVRRNAGNLLSVGIISLFFLAFVFVLFIVRQSLYVSNDEEMTGETAPESGYERLEKPLLGADEQPPAQTPDSGANRFDFTPLLKTEILQTPSLPEKKPASAKDDKEGLSAFLSDPQKTSLLKPETGSRLLPPWRRNAIPTPKLQTGQKAVALVLSYDGKNPEDLKLLKYLKHPLTISIPAFIPGAEELEKKLHSQGYEVLVSLPAEPKENIPPGIKPLTANATYEDIEKRFAWHMNRFTKTVGFKFMFDTALTEDLNVMSFLMATAEKRGVLYLNSAYPGGNVSPAAADAMGTPFATVDIHLNPENIADDLRTLYNKAQRYGYAIGSADLNAQNMNELIKYVKRMIDQETVIIPVSTAVKIEQIKKTSDMTVGK